MPRLSARAGSATVDRCLVNAEWCAMFPISNVYNMPIIHTLSDHAAILSTDGPVCKVKHTFKFENWWLKEHEFQTLLKQIGLPLKINPSLLELITLQVLSKSGARRKASQSPTK